MMHMLYNTFQEDEFTVVLFKQIKKYRVYVEACFGVEKAKDLASLLLARSTSRQVNRQVNRQAGSQTGRQAGRQAARQAGRQAGTQPDK